MIRDELPLDELNVLMERITTALLEGEVVTVITGDEEVTLSCKLNDEIDYVEILKKLYPKAFH